MNIAGIPNTFAEAERFFDHYEDENIAYSPAGAQLMAGTVQVLKSRLPAPVRPVTKTLLTAMFDDGRLTDALGLPRATRLTKATLGTVLQARNAIHRRRPMRTEPRFVPGHAGSSLYPNGYRLDDIGPENIMKPTSGQPKEPSWRHPR